MNGQSKLSVCIATYNEEHTIGRCLKSVYDWVDEIIIIDGNSTDATQSIARSFGEKVKITNVPNEQMFHKMKQKALGLATGEWILQLDADEEITPKLKEEILEIRNPKSEIRNLFVAYWIPRVNYFLGRGLKKGGQYPDYSIRLYKNGVARFPCESVHEQVQITNPKSEIRNPKKENEIGYLKNPMNHYPYPTFSAYLDKWDRYCVLEAKLLGEQHIKPTLSMGANYFLFKPIYWFLLAYIRHRGYVDGLPGFVFALFSALRYPLIYINLYEQTCVLR